MKARIQVKVRLVKEAPDSLCIRRHTSIIWHIHLLLMIMSDLDLAGTSEVIVPEICYMNHVEDEAVNASFCPWKPLVIISLAL